MTKKECINLLSDIYLQLKETKDYGKAKERLVNEIKIDKLANYYLHKYEKLDDDELSVLHLVLDIVDLIYMQIIVENI